MEQKDIIWGMIGCGDVTEVKNGPGLYLCQHSRLKGVTNRTLSKAQDWVRRHGHGQVYDSAASLLADPEIDIIYVATTPDTHLKYALACAEAGKHCLLEKPVAATYEEGIRIRDAFQQAGKRCYVAFYRRQMKRFQTLHDLIASGRIGEVMGAQLLHCTKAVTDPEAWRANPSICGGDLFTETDIHALDILVWIMGAVQDWKAVKSEDGYGLLVQFAGGKLASGITALLRMWIGSRFLAQRDISPSPFLIIRSLSVFGITSRDMKRFLWRILHMWACGWSRRL